MADTINVILRLPPDVHANLKARAAEERRSLNNMLVYALSNPAKASAPAIGTPTDEFVRLESILASTPDAGRARLRGILQDLLVRLDGRIKEDDVKWARSLGQGFAEEETAVDKALSPIKQLTRDLYTVKKKWGLGDRSVGKIRDAAKALKDVARDHREVEDSI